MKRFAAATLALVGALVLHGDAQPSAPIYLQYDGYVRNHDEHMLTLSFGYYNLNHVDVKINPGDDNTFLPGPIDRQQTVNFIEGRHRFACTIIIPEDYKDKPIQWTVKFAGKSITTTEKFLIPLYELEDNSARRVMTGIDLAKDPKNVCANHAPNVQVGGTFNANATVDVNAFPGLETPPPTVFSTTLDQELALPGQVNDDDLPRGAKVTMGWKKNSGPGTVTFNPQTTAATKVKFSAIGSYQLELGATDTAKSSNAVITVNVQPTGGPAILTEKAPDSYINAMKTIQAETTALRTSLGARNYTVASGHLATLKESFTVAQQYWQGKLQEGANIAGAALKSISDLEAANNAKDDQKLLDNQVSLNRTCTLCHQLHRQRMPDGHFEVK